MTKILLTRPYEDSLKLAEEVRAIGGEPVICPLLEIESTDTALPDNLDEFDALAFSSANGVRAFVQKSPKRNFTVFCVGPATALSAAKEGFQYIVEAEGTAEKLRDVIVRHTPKRVLYVAPEDKAFPLSQILSNSGVLCEEYVLYCAKAVQSLPGDIVHALEQKDIDIALFYSARTAGVFVDLVQQADRTQALSSIKALCLSDSVLESAHKDLWERTFVCDKPDSGSMSTLLENILKGSTMSKNGKNIENAEEIIERFGGIRPMASKIDVPVTTVQGWKKRNVIPGSRRTLIMEAANVNNIDLTDLLEGSTAEIRQFPREEPKEDRHVLRSAQEQENNKPEPDAVKETEVRAQRYEPLEGISSSKDIMAEIEASEKKAVRNSVWASTGLIALVMLGGAVLVWPSASSVKKDVNIHGEKIQVLEGDVAELDESVRDTSKRTGFLSGIMPDDLEGKFQGLQNQAQNLQNTFDQLNEKTQGLRDGVLAPDAGNLSDRVEALEEQVAELTGSANFGGLIERIKTMEDTLAGQAQLSLAVEELQTIVDGLDGKVSSIDERLQQAQSGEGPLGETLQGVSGNDLKAAAMLIAFSQLRDSLNREAPFEEDLELLQKMVGEDNTDLQDALTKLAPHADGGVLTTQGLSDEFKGLAGDIVVASLKGEDVSIADKAKARLTDIMKVEKDGEVIGGTDAQAAVSKAQALLDDGDIEGAIATLQALEGPAAQQAQPFIEQAEVTVLAQQVQSMLHTTILSNISSFMPGGVGGEQPLPRIIKPYGSSGTMDVKQITDTIKNVVPQKQVVTDEESGVSILPKQQGFKGLSDR